METVPQEPGNSTPHVQIAGHFAIIPEALLYDPSISGEEVRVYGALRRHGSDIENCYPSYERLANLLGRSERSIRYAMETLSHRGWIEKIPRFNPDGGRTSNGYIVYNEPNLARPPRNEVAGPPRKQVADEREPVEREPNTLALEVVDDATPPSGFDEFWKIYPLKKGKPAARRAWSKAVKHAQPAEIIRGAQAYADDPKRDPAYTKYPQGWLNDERWADAPVRVTQPRQFDPVDGCERVFYPGTGWVRRVN